MKKNLAIKIVCIILFPIALILKSLSHKEPDLTEKIYSRGFYKVLSTVFSNIFGIFRFSVIEIFIYLIIILFLVFLIKRILSKKKKPIKLFDLVLTVLALAGAAYFVFIASWGLNYNRKTALSVFGFQKQEVTQDKLFAIAADLRKRLIVQSEQLEDKDFELKNIINNGNLGYQNIQGAYPELGGKYADVKPVISSEIMSYLGIWGIYSPFSFEANINTMVPRAMLPSTIAHELAHTRGFAREDEANFIAYLTCIHSNDKSYEYSGNLLAFINIISALRINDANLASDLLNTLNSRVKRDLKEINDFNAKYTGILDEISTKANDLFLKSNKQSDGVRSYGRMVDLIVSEYFDN